VAASVDLVVHMAKDAAGLRRVTEIAALPGRTEGDIVEVAQVFVRREGQLVRADGFPPHSERFAEHGFDLGRLLASSVRTPT
jgi:pilus assembly protein CpaF